jgi:hypothetical protein
MDIEIVLNVLRYLDKLNQDIEQHGSDSLPSDILNHAAEIHELTEGLAVFGKIVKIEALEQRLVFAKLHDDCEAVEAVKAELKSLE